MMAAQSRPTEYGELRENVPLTRLTSWRVGGPAERLFRPSDLDGLCAFLAALPADEPLTWLGLGSNLLVRDGGIKGTVIAMHGALADVVLAGERRVRAESGVPCAKVARFSARNSLAGAEFMVGIPGTVGGALAMNAGAFGGETWERVVQVETVDRHGELRARDRDAYVVSYRSVESTVEEWFVAATLELVAGDRDVSLSKMKALLMERTRTQPTGVASCGSVFRNPPGDHAARLIEASGLKGHAIGGALVSDKHANFIVNMGDATAADIEHLVMHVREQVELQHGVTLTPEVRVVGEAA